MIDREQIAKKLVALRGGRARDDVAKAVGISVSALQMYEGARRMPRDEIKLALAKYYNTNVEQLFFEQKVHVS